MYKRAISLRVLSRRAIPALAAAALAACGGGGSSDAPPVVVPTAVRTVSASAGSDVFAEALDAQGGALARAVLSVSGDGAFDVTGRLEQSQMLRSPTITAPVNARVARVLLRLGAASAARRETAEVVRSEALTCLNVGGTGTVSGNDADGDGKLSAGDSLSISATNCVVDAGLPAISGSFTLAVNAIELDSADNATAVDATITVTAFTVAGYGTYDGSIRLWSRPEGASDRNRMSYRATTVSVGGHSEIYDFDIYGLSGASGDVFDLDGGIGIGGQTYSISAAGSFSATGAQAPASGAVRLRDAAGDTVRLTARSAATFDLEFLPAGATTATASMPGLNWADYLTAP